MTFKYSMIPTLFIVLFMLQGMGLNSMLDIRIDSVYLLIMSIFMAFLSMFLPIGKFPSTLLLGMCIHAESDSMKVNGTKGHAIRMKAIAKGRIQEISEKSNFTQCIIEGYIDTPQLPRIEHCRILLRITGSRSALKEGMNIQVRGIASNPDKTELRGEFDQMNYLQSKNIQFLIMVKETAIIQSTNNDIHSSIRFIREWIDIALSRVFPKESVPLIKGIVLGETSDISSDLRNAFALLGTAHILSVSGFHAGIISLMILFLLSWIPSLIIRNALLILSLIVFLEIIHWDTGNSCLHDDISWLHDILTSKKSTWNTCSTDRWRLHDFTRSNLTLFNWISDVYGRHVRTHFLTPISSCISSEDFSKVNCSLTINFNFGNVDSTSIDCMVFRNDLIHFTDCKSHVHTDVHHCTLLDNHRSDLLFIQRLSCRTLCNVCPSSHCNCR